MIMFDASWAAALLAASLKGSVVLLAALGATRLMRRRSAAVRHLVWACALGGMLLLPVAERVVPAWEVSAPEPIRAAAVSLAPPAAEPVDPLPTGSEAGAPAVDATGVEAVVEEEAGWAQPRLGWREGLALLWAAGAALLLGRLLAGAAGVWWLGRRATMVTDGSWLHLAHALAKRLGLSRGVTLLQGDRGTVPMTWGVLQPIVWLPADAERWAAERRTVVLAHELAHVRRRDALTQWIAHLALAVHWFNPLVWLAARRLREERERACDDAVLAIGTQPVDYADHLLEIVRSLGHRSGPVAAMAMARRSQFEGRLLAILDGAMARGGVSRRAAVGTALAAILGMAPVAALRAADPAPPSPAAQAQAESTPTHDGEVGSLHRLVDRAGRAQAPPADTIPFTLMEIVAEIGSDGEKGALLVRLVDQPTADARLLAQAVEAAATIRSDAERGSVLTAVLSRPTLDAATLAEAIRATRGMTSPAEIASVLRLAVTRPQFGAGPAVDAFFAALPAVTAPAEKASLLHELVGRPALTAPVLVRALQATSTIGSDSEASAVLVRAARARPRPFTEPVRDAYLAAVRTLDSDSERTSALSALLGGGEQGGTWDATIELHGAHEGRPAYDLRLHASRVELTADERGIAGVRPGGYLTVEHTRFPGSPDPDPLLPAGSRRILARSLRVTPGADGSEVYLYRVDGEEREFGDEGRAWLAHVLRLVLDD